MVFTYLANLKTSLRFTYSATVTNLQSRSETLTTTNALLSEDLARAKAVILSLQEKLKASGNTDSTADEVKGERNATENDTTPGFAELEKENDILVGVKFQ